MRSSQAHHNRRTSRPALRFEALENRLQPNDMFGLGLSVLGAGSLLDLGSPVEAPSAVVREQEITLVADTVDTTTEQSQFAPLPSQAEVLPPALDDASAIRSVFDAASSVDPLFSLETQPARPATRMSNPVADLVDPVRQLLTFLTAAAPVQAGHTQTVMPPTHQQSEGRLLADLAGTQKTLGEDEYQIDGPTTVTLTAGATSATINSFGFSATFSSGTPDALFEHENLYSDGGPVRRINAANCTIVTPIAEDPSTPEADATSEITCGAVGIFYYHLVDADLQGWISAAIVTTARPTCLYGYTDYDMPPDENNDSSLWLPIGDGILGTFAVQDNDTPAIDYLYIDLSDARHYEQAVWPTLRDRLRGFTTCTDLTDSPETFGPGDWTGALQWNLPGGTDPAVILYAHLRLDIP